MSDYRFAKPNEDSRTQLTSTVAAEFIYGLDAFLEYWNERSGRGVPIKVVAAVAHCCEAALDLLVWSATEHVGPRNIPELKRAATNDALAAKIIGSTVDVLRRLPEGQASTPTAIRPGLPKWQVMGTLAGEFLLRFGALAESVVNAAQGKVDSHDVEMLRGCVDAAMGMFYELDDVEWPAGHAVPARAILAMHNHVISNSLECAGPQAVQLVEEVYECVVDLVMSEA